MTASADLRPVDSSLFTWPSDTPQLRGSQCDECGWREFPFTGTCGRCGLDSASEYLLPRRGKVWSFTTQEFELKPPYVGEPGRLFSLGYVDFDGLAVEGHFTTSPGDVRTEAAIGTEMEVVVVPFIDGTVTYAFQPVSEEN
jgi:uncharacterized OB-fold protein